jgi:hypothetical protein
LAFFRSSFKQDRKAVLSFEDSHNIPRKVLAIIDYHPYNRSIQDLGGSWGTPSKIVGVLACIFHLK